MNKVIVGLLLGGLLGIFDGLTAWFTPAVRAGIIGIVIGSCIKGMIAGVAAGWFARKVQSVVAGLLFGLGVGLVLAWLVAFLQHGYYFEIMLPGGIVGAIVGWATQRYGRPSMAVASAMMLVVALCTLNVRAAEGTDNVTAAEAFGRLKTLAGRWNTHVMTPEGPLVNVDYRVSGGGTVVMETLFSGAPHEMITMYTLDGDNLVATHYCAMGNQPTMKLDLAASTRDSLVFQFVGVRGQNATGDHVHDGRIRFLGNGDVQSEWNSTASEPKRFFQNRAK
ncbi:MAG TPA: hypothetical protein VF505_09875 [Thermoanaerobaculia bacterium]|jgi:hypothetical protein